MASGAPGSELGRTSRRSGPILRNPVSVTYEYASSIRAFSASFRRSSVPDKVGDCVRSCYNEAAMTFDSALTIRDTPSTIPYTTYTPPKTIATTPTNRMASTTPTCTTTLYTEPVITFGPTSTAWADTITSVRSVDCSGCDLAVLYGGHIYQVRTALSTSFPPHPPLVFELIVPFNCRRSSTPPLSMSTLPQRNILLSA
jgi:hypothetical protein